MGNGACLKFLPCVDGVNAMATKVPLELCLSTTFCSHVSSFQIFTQNDSLSTFQGLPMEEYVEFKSKVTQVWSHGALQGLFIQMIKGEDLFIFSHLLILIATMSSDQCANNSDSSLKDAKDIQYLNDPDDSNPLPTPTAEPLGCGLQSKATNWLSDALAHELLDSDEEDAEDADGFTKITRCKCTSCAASNASSGAATPALSLANSFEVLPDEDSENDDNGDRSFKTKSNDNSDEDDMPGLEPMSDDKVSNNEVLMSISIKKLTA